MSTSSLAAARVKLKQILYKTNKNKKFFHQ